MLSICLGDRRDVVKTHAMNPYETEKLLNEYLLFHYGADADILPWAWGPREALGYPIRCVSECVDITALPGNARALEVGCAVGRSAFELARHCAEVVAVDFSGRFIEAAKLLQSSGSLVYSRADEGEIFTALTASLPAQVDAQRVRFEVGDACALRTDLGAFDVVLGANLVDRLPAPERFAAALPSLVKPGGQLVLTSPYTWMEEYTPRAKWLGGCSGRSTLDGLRLALEPEFSLLETKDLPFLIREHVRKYQWSVAQASIWRRNL